MPTPPAKTIRSAIDTIFFFVSKPLLIFSNLPRIFDNFFGLFTDQLFCGSSLILAPFAPPLLSDPLKVDGRAQAVDTSSDIEKPDFIIF